MSRMERPVGRPRIGESKKSVNRKVMLDQRLDNLLVAKCKQFGITISEGIREAIKLFIHDGKYS